ncbi:MAG: MBL fold metallo-hydrolase, partial [Pyrinomonadaceae bacterium]
MARSRRGCGCALAVLLAIAVAAGVIGWKFVLPWWKRQPPPASGGELQVHILDVGPVDGDSILIISPAGKVVLIDAGDVGKGNKVVLDALKRYGVQQIDYFIATHAHADHIGGAAEVIKAVKTVTVLHNGFPPPEWTEQQEQAANQNNKNAKGKNQAGKQANVKQQAKPAKTKGKSTELPTVKT